MKKDQKEDYRDHITRNRSCRIHRKISTKKIEKSLAIDREELEKH